MISGSYPFETATKRCAVCQGEVDQPVQLFDALHAAPSLIAKALESRRSAAPEGWSAEYVAAHLADLEVHRGMRIRRILTEDNPEIGSIDQDAWAEALRYERRDTRQALENFASNRRTNLEIVQLAGDEGLARPYASFAGPMTLLSLMEHTSHHDLGHLRQILG